MPSLTKRDFNGDLSTAKAIAGCSHLNIVTDGYLKRV